MDDKKIIIILDYSTTSVYITEYDSKKYESYEDKYIELNKKHNLGLKDSQCNCMIIEDELIIKKLT